MFILLLHGRLALCSCLHSVKNFCKKIAGALFPQIQPFREILSAVWCGCSYIFSVDLALIFQHAMVVTIFLWHVHIFTTNVGFFCDNLFIRNFKQNWAENMKSSYFAIQDGSIFRKLWDKCDFSDSLNILPTHTKLGVLPFENESCFLEEQRWNIRLSKEAFIFSSLD